LSYEKQSIAARNIPAESSPAFGISDHLVDARRTGSMSATDKRKQSLYFPETMLQEIQKEAARLDRSLSWIVQRCVKIGLSDIRKLPSVNDVADAGDDDGDDA
jgi:uncharacterized small protein (TIGR04563 family)